MPRLPLRNALILITTLATCACDKTPKEDRRGPPPPPPPSATTAANVCANGGGTITDATTAALFPKSIADYCIDPNGETRVYGARAPKNLDAICTEAFNGDCEVYKSFGLERVAILRYVDGGGSPGSVDVVLSKYTSAEGAYGMFTKRVISDGDPAREGFPREMKISGVGAQGTGTAYLWKGQLVVELTYTNDQQTPKQLEATSGKLLATLGKAISEKLPAPDSLPDAASRLPSEHRLPLGIQFEPKDAFGVNGGGAGAYGYYRDGKKRYRVLSITRDDEPQAKDVLTSILKREGAARVKDVGNGAVRLMVGEADGPRAEWLVARVGKQLFGIGDEESVLKPGMSSAEHDEVSLTRDEKLERLRALLSTK